MDYRIAIVGATGSVGREMINILHERGFNLEKVTAIASKNSQGKKIQSHDCNIICQTIEDVNFEKFDFVLMSAGSQIAKKLAPEIARNNTFVIDNSSYFRMHEDVPLIVPEVNPQQLKEKILEKNARIIANPNCSTAQLVVAVKPLHDYAKIKRIVVATYQSVSGAGAKASDELFEQTRNIYSDKKTPAKYFSKQIAFNVIPHIDVFLENGDTKEEWKMQAELNKIIGDDIKLTATAVRVPVFVGHSEAVNIEFEKPIDEKEAREILSKAPGCIVIDERKPAGYITPVECVGNYATFISRIRKDNTVKYGLNLWVVSDNLRKGAALNSVQIMECIINQKLFKHKNEYISTTN